MKTTTTLSAVLAFSYLLFSSPLFSFSLHCPEDVWINCGDETEDLSIYGNAYYHNYSGYHDAGEASISQFLNDCGVGVIKRTWSVEDENWVWHSCSQFIHIEGDVFQETDITWPDAHIVLEGCNPNTDPAETGEPAYNYAFCSVIGVNTDDQLFHLGPECKKLLRTWTIIDWCTFNPDLGYGSPGSWQFTQTIKISNTEEPSSNCIEEIVVSTTNCESKFVEIPSVILSPSSCGGEYEITHNSIYADKPGSDATGTYPIGTTEVKYRIEYGCGLYTFCHVNVVVQDGSKPVPYCIQELITTLMPMDEDSDGIFESGMVEIWAKDFNVGSYHPCDYGPLQYSFTEDVDSMSTTFTCDNLGDNPLRMYVTDPNGNQSYCIVNLEIQNNSGLIENCVSPPPMVIGGKLAMLDKNPLKFAEVKLRNMYPEVKVEISYDTIISTVVVDSFYSIGGVLMYVLEEQEEVNISTDTTYHYNEVSALTFEDGTYLFEELQDLGSYYLKATKKNYNARYITDFDVIKLERYLNGEFEVRNPHFQLAADIDVNGKIDKEDLTLLKEIVASGPGHSTMPEPWIIVEQNNSNISVDTSSTIEIHALSEGTMNKDFVAILRGNLSRFKNETSLQGQLINRSVSNFEWKVSPNPFSEIFNIEFHSEEERNIQFELMNSTGRIILNSEIQTIKGDNRIPFDLKSHALDAGVYFLRVLDMKQVILHHSKLIKI